MAKLYRNKLRQVRGDMEKLIQRDLPRIVKREGLQFISDNFSQQGFQSGSGVDKWKSRKPPKGRKAKRRQGRSLLVDRGHLRRNWEQETTEQPGKVTFQNSHPAAEVHNEGGENMPQRQMIGESNKLDKMIEQKVDKVMNRILKD